MEGVTLLGRDTVFTRDDLDAMPDDGRRHELIDGSLVVTPAPSRRHQVTVKRLARLLEDGVDTKALDVLFAPFDVVLADDTIVQPDVLVAPIGQFTDRDLPGPPLLAVEVLSPSTRRIDLHLKLARYAAAGVPAYWVVDPDGPSLIAYALADGGAYEEAGRVTRDEELRLTAPFPIVIHAADLA